MIQLLWNFKFKHNFWQNIIFWGLNSTIEFELKLNLIDSLDQDIELKGINKRTELTLDLHYNDDEMKVIHDILTIQPHQAILFFWCCTVDMANDVRLKCLPKLLSWRWVDAHITILLMSKMCSVTWRSLPLPWLMKTNQDAMPTPRSMMTSLMCGLLLLWTTTEDEPCRALSITCLWQ